MNEQIVPAWKAEALWPYLVTLAVFLFVLDVLLRRVDFARYSSRNKSRNEA